MAAEFIRTARSLEEGGSRLKALLTVAAVVVAALWGGWFFLSALGVYHVTGNARLESAGVSHAVVSKIDGLVAANSLQLGEQVEAGQMLLTLDDREYRLALETGGKRLEALQLMLKAYEFEIESERRGMQASDTAAGAAQEEKRKGIVQARESALFSDRKVERTEKMLAARAVSVEQFDAVQTEARVSRLAIDTLAAGLEKIVADHVVTQTDRTRRIAHRELEREGTRVEIEEQAARLKELALSVERCRILAPVSGRIGHAKDLPPGSGITARLPLAYVIPHHAPRAVAFFAASSAGRIREGQAARLRLEGYPWTQYGSLPATVSRVGAEPENGLIRVELNVAAGEAFRIPVEHGLPGSAEVIVERVSPAVLVLRTIGWLLRSGGSSSPATRT